MCIKLESYHTGLNVYIMELQPIQSFHLLPLIYHSCGVHIKAHSGIWKTRSIWPISNSEIIPRSARSRPLGMCGIFHSGWFPRLISSKYPSGDALGIFCWYTSRHPIYHSASPRGIWGDSRYIRPYTTRFSYPLVGFYIIYPCISQPPSELKCCIPPPSEVDSPAWLFVRNWRFHD